MTRYLRVQADIPAPHPFAYRIQWPFKTMKVGESVLIDHERSASAMSAVTRMRECGLKFTRRKQREGYRFWRVA